MGTWTFRGRHARGCRIVLGIGLAAISMWGGVGPAAANTHSRRHHPTARVRLGIALGKAKKLEVRISAPRAAKCDLTVRAARRTSRLPAVFTNRRGRAVLVWSVPANAPSGRWTFSVVCRTRRLRMRARTSLLLVNHGSGHGAVSAPDSVRVQQGELGGKGAGPCPAGAAPDQNGRCVSFPGDPFNYYQGGTDVGQCTWYAAGRRPDLWGITTGNAKDWLTQAHGHDLEGTVPVVGAVAVRTLGTWGHVAYVVGVTASGAPIVDDSNYYNDVTVRYDHAVPAGYFQGYIYGGPAGGGPSSGSGGSPSGGGGSSATGSGYETAFQANTGSLIEFGTGGDANTTQGMMAGTSPSIAALPGGGYEMAFQANTGNLIVYGTGGNIDTGQGMKSGTSPSIAASPGGGFEVAFQANTGNLYIYNSATGPANLQQGMDNQTSPSIAALPGGGYEIAFQANTGSLIVYGSAANTNTGQGMMSGTSPSIAASPRGGFQVAFQANTGNLYRYNSATGPANLQQGMDNQTSPSIAALSSGGYEMAFQANTGNLIVYGDGSNADTQQGMKAGTSPSIAGAPQAGFEVAFQANTGNLYTYNSATGAANLQQGMDNSTSPGIAP